MDLSLRKQTLRMLSNGMYIVTSATGARYGAATITWLSQASFKPPLIMAAIRPTSKVFECLTESRVAAVHILDMDQQDMAQRFFAPPGSSMAPSTASPLCPASPLLRFCKTLAPISSVSFRDIVKHGGDHAVVVMEVVEARCRAELRPLIVAASPWAYGG